MKHFASAFTLAVALTSLAATPARADTKLAVGGGAGSLGYGVEASVPLVPLVDLRAGYGTFATSFNGTSNSFSYDGTAKLSNVSALLDFHPIPWSSFRVSTGVVNGNNRIGVNGAMSTNGTYTLNGTTYQVSSVGNVVGSITFGGTNPYVGIGFGKAFGHRFTSSVTFDAGIVAENAPSVSLSAPNNTIPAQGQAAFQANLAAERASIASDLGFLRTYPVVRVGFQTHI